MQVCQHSAGVLVVLVAEHAVRRCFNHDLHAAFNQRTTPELDGEVIHIGADVTQDDRASEPYYSVRIRVRDGELDRLDGLQLIADMPVEAFIQTTPRTVASFLVKPLTDQLARAFRGR